MCLGVRLGVRRRVWACVGVCGHDWACVGVCVGVCGHVSITHTCFVDSGVTH